MSGLFRSAIRVRGVARDLLRPVSDFTRVTKAMSAALVLAAIRHELPQLRYLSGGRRDERGLVVPGTEIVTDIRTTVATTRRRLDEASDFLLRLGSTGLQRRIASGPVTVSASTNSLGQARPVGRSLRLAPIARRRPVR